MELSQYWRAAGRRKLILFVLPVVAVGAAAPRAMDDPPQYRATATVNVDSSERAGTPPAVIQSVYDFSALVKSNTLRNRVSERTGVPTARLDAGLQVRQIGQGNLAEVSYSSPRRDEVRNVTRTAATTAYSLLYEAERSRGRKEIAVAQKRLDQAVARRGEFLAEGGHPLVREDYDLQSRELSELRLLLARAHADGDAGRAARLAPLVAAKEAEVDQLGARVVRFDLLEDEVKRASSILVEAQQELTVVEALAELADEDALAVSSIEQVPRLPGIIEKLATAGVLSFVLAAALLLISELLRPSWRRPAGGPEQPESEVVVIPAEANGSPALPRPAPTSTERGPVGPTSSRL